MIKATINVWHSFWPPSLQQCHSATDRGWVSFSCFPLNRYCFPWKQWWCARTLLPLLVSAVMCAWTLLPFLRVPAWTLLPLLRVQAVMCAEHCSCYSGCLPWCVPEHCSRYSAWRYWGHRRPSGGPSQWRRSSSGCRCSTAGLRSLLRSHSETT